MVNWSLGDGKTCRVYAQPWFLIALQFTPQVAGDRRLTVSQLVDEGSGNWNVEAIAALFGYGVALHIVTNIRPPREEGGRDSLIFHLSANGQFSAKKAYMAMTEVQNQGQAQGDLRKLWSHIWHAGEAPPRIRLFMWKVAHGALPLNKLMSTRLGRGDPLCTICGQEEEAIVHMVLTFPFARSAWFAGVLGLRTEGLTEPIQDTLKMIVRKLSDEQWSSFIASCWAVWRCRNECVFQGKIPTREAFQKFLNSVLMENLIAASSRRTHPSNSGNRFTSSLESGERVCYVDGSWAFGWIGGAGFLITAHHTLYAYRTARTMTCCAIQAEATAMLLAIDFVQAEGLHSCRFLTDCKTLADACTGPHPPMEVDWRAHKEVFEIWKIMKGTADFSVCHIDRSHNVVADELAKRGRRTGELYTGYTYPIFSPMERN